MVNKLTKVIITGIFFPFTLGTAHLKVGKRVLLVAIQLSIDSDLILTYFYLICPKFMRTILFFLLPILIATGSHCQSPELPSGSLSKYSYNLFAISAEQSRLHGWNGTCFFYRKDAKLF